MKPASCPASIDFTVLDASPLPHMRWQAIEWLRIESWWRDASPHDRKYWRKHAASKRRSVPRELQHLATRKHDALLSLDVARFSDPDNPAHSTPWPILHVLTALTAVPLPQDEQAQAVRQLEPLLYGYENTEQAEPTLHVKAFDFAYCDPHRLLVSIDPQKNVNDVILPRIQALLQEAKDGKHARGQGHPPPSLARLAEALWAYDQAQAGWSLHRIGRTAQTYPPPKPDNGKSRGSELTQQAKQMLLDSRKDVPYWFDRYR